MSKFIAAAALVASFAAAPAVFAAQPVAQNADHLTKAPAGSMVQVSDIHQGDRVENIYRVSADGSLKLVDQVRYED
ncbi:hypothetical protein FJU08_11540 [Martelella alba]|uniref:YpeB-like protein with protease inhibitory function n=1 Tax=Martelella alba TaxID=2590451 RepID=A0A506U847_9HYPH|nr:hypothetical protein [Martelella alba]TPW30592.1 hypothetical protein FJU08_11540 [Martelella alba]